MKQLWWLGALVLLGNLGIAAYTHYQWLPETQFPADTTQNTKAESVLNNSVSTTTQTETYQQLEALNMWSFKLAAPPAVAVAPPPPPPKTEPLIRLLAITQTNQEHKAVFLVGEKIERVAMQEKLSNGWQITQLNTLKVQLNSNQGTKEFELFKGQ